YWWTLPGVRSMSPNGELTLNGLMKANGVCPEWNNGSFLETCTVPESWSFVVGQGQSATCQWGNSLFPPASLLQANGNVCDVALKCQTCNLKHDFGNCFSILKASDPEYASAY
ncbi:unnamed protein product, partial [Symbiodinium pilosum]